MGKIEVDEEKLRRFVDASLFTCMDLNYHLFKYKSCTIRCQDCPLTTVESTIEWLKETNNSGSK